MARFRFKIVDSSGRRRSGVLRADSLEVAESALRSKLCQIEELIPLADDGQAVDVGKLESSFSQVDRIRRGLAAVMAMVFAISLYTWVTQERKPPIKTNDQKVLFQVKGELALGPADGDPSDWKVYVVFPDVPFEVGGSLKDENNAFTYPVELQGTRRPTQVRVEVELDKRRWALPEKVAMPATGDLDLGLLTLTRPAKEKEYVSPTYAHPSTKGHQDGEKPRRKLNREDWRRAMTP